jgi:hypothetical protein
LARRLNLPNLGRTVTRNTIRTRDRERRYIPSAIGAWALAYRDTSQGDAAYTVAGAGTNQAVPFQHFHTSDESVFSTGLVPGYGVTNNAAGDDILLCLKPGAYVFESGATWTTNFASQAFVGISVQTYRGPNWQHPADLHGNAAATPLFTDNVYLDARVYAFATGEVPANVIMQVAQTSGSNKNLKQMWLRVAYFPTVDSFTQVYG